MKSPLRFIVLTSVLACAGIAAWMAIADRAQAAPISANASYLKNPRTGGLEIKSVSSLSFGPGGLLLVAEPVTGSMVAIETGDTGPVKKLKGKVENVAAIVAEGLGATADNVTIRDMAVNPASGVVYLAVMRKPDNASAILKVDATGKASALDMQKLPWARATLPAGSASKVTAVTDVGFAEDRIFVAGSCNEEFASKIYSVPLPLENGASASVYSAETYHVSHRKWETRAPISSFVCEKQQGKQYVVGAFACTPIAKFPVDGLQSGAQVKGVSVVELGSGNRPLDMFTYKKGGKEWLVTHTQRFKQNAFGPSKFWGARINMDYLRPDDPDKTNQNAVRRDERQDKGPAGIEIVDALFGAVQADKLSDEEAVVLRDTDGVLSLEIAALP